jgi:hypothetical protein
MEAYLTATRSDTVVHSTTLNSCRATNAYIWLLANVCFANARVPADYELNYYNTQYFIIDGSVSDCDYI